MDGLASKFGEAQERQRAEDQGPLVGAGLCVAQAREDKSHERSGEGGTL
jgi:hypothetical protein